MVDSIVENMFSRNDLHVRHRLSHQQIDALLNENSGSEHVAEKLYILGAVKELVWLSDLLGSVGISFVSFKGPLLSQLIYGDPAVRFSHDIDILVDVAEVDAVINLLLGNGYELGIGNHWPSDERKKSVFAKINHHITFRSKSSGLLVEVHWKLLVDMVVSKRRMATLISENRMPISIGGRSIYTLSYDFCLAYLVIHGAKHGWQRLKWLVDIKDFPYGKVDAAHFASLVKELRIHKQVAQASYLAKLFLGVELPILNSWGSASRLLCNHAIKYISNPVEENLSVRAALADAYYRFRLIGSLRYKLKMLDGMLIGGFDLQDRSFPFTFMYYIYRPYSFIKRRLMNA